MELKIRKDGNNEQIIADLLPEIPKAVRMAFQSHPVYKQESEDLCQQIVLKLIESDYRRYRSFDNKRASLKTWLGVVVRHHVRRHLRREKQLRDKELVLAEALNYLPAPEADILYSQRRMLLQTVLRRLSGRDRQLYEFLCSDDLGDADIARLMNIPHDLVRKRRYKLIRKIQRLIDDA